MEDEKTAGMERQHLDLFQAAELLLEECRMVLPGIQGLFGFQLIAVFSEGFHARLDAFEQDLHLGAIALIGLAIALIMTPAAINRRLDPRIVSAGFVALSARLLLWSMLPLALGLCLDFYLVARVITGSVHVLWLALPMAAVFLALWWWLPRRVRARLG
jgi:xanthine/uracil/vitamin C permease (AzgA family)